MWKKAVVVWHLPERTEEYYKENLRLTGGWTKI
jgi:hypothetical protein